MRYFIMPRVTSLYHHYSNEPSICDAFDKTHVPYISDTLHIIRSVLKPKFIHYSKYVQYRFFLFLKDPFFPDYLQFLHSITARSESLLGAQVVLWIKHRNGFRNKT